MKLLQLVGPDTLVSRKYVCFSVKSVQYTVLCEIDTHNVSTIILNDLTASMNPLKPSGFKTNQVQCAPKIQLMGDKTTERRKSGRRSRHSRFAIFGRSVGEYTFS